MTVESQAGAGEKRGPGERVVVLWDVPEWSHLARPRKKEDPLENELFDVCLSAQGLIVARRQDISGQSQREVLVRWKDLSDVVIEGYRLRVPTYSLSLESTARETLLTQLEKASPGASKRITYASATIPNKRPAQTLALLSLFPAIGGIFGAFALIYIHKYFQIYRSDKAFWDVHAKHPSIFWTTLMAIVGTCQGAGVAAWIIYDAWRVAGQL